MLFLDDTDCNGAEVPSAFATCAAATDAQGDRVLAGGATTLRGALPDVFAPMATG